MTSEIELQEILEGKPAEVLFPTGERALLFADGLYRVKSKDLCNFYLSTTNKEVPTFNCLAFRSIEDIALYLERKEKPVYTSGAQEYTIWIPEKSDTDTVELQDENQAPEYVTENGYKILLFPNGVYRVQSKSYPFKYYITDDSGSVVLEFNSVDDALLFLKGQVIRTFAEPIEGLVPCKVWTPETNE